MPYGPTSWLRHGLAVLCIACVALLAGGASARSGSGQTSGPVATQTAALPAAGLATAGAEHQILGARLGVHPDKTRFVLDLSAATPFRVETQSNPWRVVIDLPELAWAVPSLPQGRGLVRAVGREPAAAGRSRLVLDTTGPIHVLQAAVIPPRDGHPPRFILDLSPGDGRTRAGQTAGTLAAANPPAALPPAARVAAATVPPPVARKPLTKPLVVLDPGHGGKDPGAHAVNGVHEKEITLAMAREVRRQLLATGRYRVEMTRDRDIYIPLRERVAFARDKGADLFISLHADSIGRSEVRGLSVYTLSETASDKEAAMLAERENLSDAIAGVDLKARSAQVASILINMAQRDTMNRSLRFASGFLGSLDRQVAVLPNRPLRSAGFAVLTAPDIPSVLVEMGYLSHRGDATLLASQTHRKRLGAAFVRAVDAFFAKDTVLSRS